MEQHEQKTSIIEETEKINVGTNDNPREVQIRVNLSP